MQDILLRVFVVTVSLIMYPKEDPRVEEWDNVVKSDMQERNGRLLEERRKLDQEITSISQKMTEVETEGSYQEHGLPKEGLYEPETDTKTSQEDHEDQLTVPHVKDHLKLDEDGAHQPSERSEDIQASGSVRDQSILPGQQELPEKEEVLGSEQEVSHLHTETSEKDHLEKTIADGEKDFLWYIWNTFSIIATIRFINKYLRRYSQKKYVKDCTSEDNAIPVNSISGDVAVPDSDTLHRFHARCIKASPNGSWRAGEFLEGFVNDLLEAMRTTSERSVGIIIEDFQIVEDVCDIIVPLTPPEPYSFQCQLWSNQASDMPPDMQGCGKIKIVENVNRQNGCHCKSSDMGDDMLCLLHCQNETVNVTTTDIYNLCTKNTHFLSRSQITKWFQSMIRQAWACMSHKYEFEFNFRNIDAPGALVVKFRSGKKINFNMNPVVKFDKTSAYFFIPPCSTTADIFWTLSLTIYEHHLFKSLSKNLPEKTCHIQILEIVHFLHKKQTVLTGRSALQDFHFKTTLMHLLLTQEPSQWHQDYIDSRLQDLLVFLEKSLCRRLLHHALIGNPLTQSDIELPAVFSNAKPVNLFHPLVEDDSLYSKTVKHFQEILKNTHMLVQDYVTN
ncbi:inositol 1,4,5-trisphosphate receptor-interacting protein [Polymixia lowei]